MQLVHSFQSGSIPSMHLPASYVVTFFIWYINHSKVHIIWGTIWVWWKSYGPRKPAHAMWPVNNALSLFPRQSSTYNSVLWHFQVLPYAVEHFKLCLYLALCQHTNLVVCLLLWKSREILDLTSARAGLHTAHRLHSAPRLPAARLSQLCAALRAAHTISWSWSSPRTSRPSPSPSWWRRRRRRLWSRWSRRRRRWRWWRPGGTRVWCSRVWLVWGTRVCCWTPGFGPRVRAFRWINYFFSPMQCTNLFGLLILANLTSSSKFAGSVISTVWLTGLCILIMVELKLCFIWMLINSAQELKFDKCRSIVEYRRGPICILLLLPRDCWPLLPACQ